MRDYSSLNFKAWNSASRVCIVIVLLFLSCAFFTACSCIGANNCNNDTTGTTSGGTISGGTTTGGGPGTSNCLGYEKTDPEVPDQGKTVTFNVTVPDGCDVIVQGVVGQNIGPYNWDNGAVAALGPGTYSFTIQDGSYQMASDANGNAAFCNAVQWIRNNGKALSELYPLSGWTSC